MEERNKKTELLVGLFLTVGLLLLGALIVQFSSIRELFKGTYNITLPLPDASGIKEGSPVMLGGSRIGKVAKTPQLNAAFNGVTILMDIYKEKRIPMDSKFALGTAGLLGDAFIQIKTSGNASDQYFAEGSTIPEDNVTKNAGLSGLQDTAEKLSKQVDAAIKDLHDTATDVRTSLKHLNEGAFSEGAMNELKGSFKHLNSLMTRLDEKTFSDQTSTDLKDTIASLKHAGKSVEDAMQKLDPAFIKIDKAAAKADGVMDSADKALKSIDKSATTVGQVAGDLKKGNGLLAALMSDAQLKTDLAALIRNLREHGLLFYRDSAGKAQKSGKKNTDDDDGLLERIGRSTPTKP